MFQWIKNIFKKGQLANGGPLPSKEGYLFGEDPHWPRPLPQDLDNVKAAQIHPAVHRAVQTNQQGEE